MFCGNQRQRARIRPTTSFDGEYAPQNYQLNVATPGDPCWISVGVNGWGRRLKEKRGNDEKPRGTTLRPNQRPKGTVLWSEKVNNTSSLVSSLYQASAAWIKSYLLSFLYKAVRLIPKVLAASERLFLQDFSTSTKICFSPIARALRSELARPIIDTSRPEDNFISEIFKFFCGSFTCPHTKYKRKIYKEAKVVACVQIDKIS